MSVALNGHKQVQYEDQACHERDQNGCLAADLQGGDVLELVPGDQLVDELLVMLLVLLLGVTVQVPILVRNLLVKMRCHSSNVLTFNVSCNEKRTFERERKRERINCVFVRKRDSYLRERERERERENSAISMRNI